MEHAPTIFSLLHLAIPLALQTMVACMAIVLVLAYLARQQLGEDALIPPEGFNLRNAVEIVFEGVASLMKETIGPDWPRYVPLVGTMGLFILVSNLMRQVPGLDGPTGYLETNLSWAAMAFAVSEYAAIKHQGPVTYLKHLAGPVLLLAPLMIIVETLSHLARMGSLTIRLTGNMFADHTLIALFLSFPVVQIFVPWLFAGLGLFVAFVQAFVFTFLTIVYIGLALEDAHH